MSGSTERRGLPRPKSFMPAVGAVALVGVALYFGFMAVDGLGLRDQRGTARVAAKEYREAGRSYATQPVGGHNLTRVQTTPEMYILELEIDGRPSACPVAKETYDAVAVGDQLQVTYQQRRVLGRLQVTEVRR